MSQDEMVFEDIQYREPHRLRRPDRDRRWACLAYEVPGSDDLPIFLDRATADTIERHALRDTSVELGGILLGKECVDDITGEPFVWITQSLEAKHYENTQASFTYTHDAWEEITRERDRLHPDLDIVGWYHTHPDFGIFLSSHDLFIHHHFFAQKLQVAYVVDPIRQTRGFFRWRDGQMEQVGGFYLSADRKDRVALVRLVNDLENITPPPDSGGGGGSFSPRLEAELIAMLSRPAIHHQGSTAADRAQLATLFGMAGALLGVAGLAAVMWINQLNGSLKDQATAITSLQKTLEETANRQRFLYDTIVDTAGGKSAEGLVEQYAKASRDRDELQRKLEEKALVLDKLGTDLSLQTTELAKAIKDRDRFKEDARDAEEAKNLRFRVAELNEETQHQKQLIAALGGETPEGKKTVDIVQKYQTTWYAAVAGWTVSLLLGLGMAAGYVLLGRPPIGEEPTPENPPPPHRIV